MNLLHLAGLGALANVQPSGQLAATCSDSSLPLKAASHFASDPVHFAWWSVGSMSWHLYSFPCVATYSLTIVPIWKSPVHGSSGSFHLALALVQVAAVHVPLTVSQPFLLVPLGSEHWPHVSSDVLLASEQVPSAAQAVGPPSVALLSEHVPAIPGPCTMQYPGRLIVGLCV